MLSLYGRPQDRLSHVLIDAGYEGLRGFYYPTPVSHMITARDGKTLDASGAQVSLADIPFIRLRDDLPDQLIKGKKSFRETIETMRLIEEPLSLDFGSAREQTVYCSGVAIKLPPAEYAFYDFIVNECQTKNGELIRIPFEVEPSKSYAESFIQCLESCDGQAKETTVKALKCGMSHEYFRDRVVQINKVLKAVLGNRVAAPYMLKVRGKRGSGLYGIDPAVFEGSE